MKKSQAASVIAAVVAVAVIGLQYAQISRLKEEANALQAAGESNAVAAANASDGRPEKAAQGGATGAQPEDPALLDANSAPKSLKEILAQRDPMSRIRALLDYADRIDTREIAGALRELRETTPDWDPEARIAAQLLLTRWGDEDPYGAFASLKTGDPRQGGGYATVLASLAARDPQRAVDWLNDPDNTVGNMPFVGHILAGTIAKEWVRSDPEAAMAWAKSLPDSQPVGAYTGLLVSLAGTDPAGAAVLATDLEPGGDRSRIVGEIAKTWAKTSPGEALFWAQSLESADRKQAIREALTGWSQAAPAEAAAYIDKMPADERDDKAVTAVAGAWARQAPADAATWVADLSEGDTKTEAMGQVMWRWTTADPEAASTWLDGQPPSPSRDRGIVSLALATFESDPGAAISWASAISDQQSRAEAIDRGVKEWIKRNPEAAQEWLEQTDVLSAEEVKQFSER